MNKSHTVRQRKTVGIPSILHSSFIIHHSRMCLEEYDRINKIMDKGE